MGMNTMITGMVLSSMPISEYDKRVTILTLDRGKISAFARGARRPNSPLLASTNPFVFGEFEVYEGRSSYQLVKAEIKNYFSGVTSDLACTYYGSYFLEEATYFSQENTDEKNMVKLLYQTLRALEHEGLEKELVKLIYDWKLLVLGGIYPNMFSCQCCGSREHLVGFSVSKAGAVCTECIDRESVLPMHRSTLYTLQYIISTEIEKLYQFTVSRQVLAELKELLCQYREKYVGHKFKSEKFLDDILL